MKLNVKRLGLPLLLAATLTGIVGCQSTPDGGRTAGRTLDDNVVTDRVETALREAPTYKFDGVKVSTFGGVVQLSGWVAANDQKDVAERIAKNTLGANKVVNSISVIDNEMNQPQPNSQGGTKQPTFQGGTQ